MATARIPRAHRARSRRRSPPASKFNPAASAGKTRAKARKAPKAVIPAAIVTDTVAAISLLEVTMRSLQAQEIGTCEQEVLKLALKTLWKVHTQDFLVLSLALDLLTRFTDGELAKARRQNNNAKQAAMLNMREQIATVRAKVRAMQAVQS